MLLKLEIYHRHDKSLTADDHEPVQSNLHLYNQYFLDIICCYGSNHVRCFQSNLLKYSHPVGFVHGVFFPPGKYVARSFPALGVDGSVTLNVTLNVTPNVTLNVTLNESSRNRNVRRGLDGSDSTLAHVAGCCEKCHEPSGSWEYGEFLY
jgi:hypothetical protein